MSHLATSQHVDRVLVTTATTRASIKLFTAGRGNRKDEHTGPPTQFAEVAPAHYVQAIAQAVEVGFLAAAEGEEPGLRRCQGQVFGRDHLSGEQDLAFTANGQAAIGTQRRQAPFPGCWPVLGRRA